MILKIIGFEGSWPEDVPATYGAAALRDGDYLINGLTGSRRQPADEIISKYVAQGSITLLEQKVNSEKEFAYVVAYRKNKFPSFISKTPSFQINNNLYYFYHKEEYPGFCNEIERNLIKILLSDRNDELWKNGISVAMTFMPRSPYTHAFRVFKSANRDNALRTASSLIASESEKEKFKKILVGLDTNLDLLSLQTLLMFS